MCRWSSAAFALAVLLSSVVAGAQTEEATDLLGRAYAAFGRGAYEEATTLLDEAATRTENVGWRRNR